MWINTKQTKHKPVSRCPFTAWASVRKSAATTIPGRRNEYEIKKKLLAGTLSALCILFAGCGKAAKNEPALPEVRNNGTAIQWKYSGETDWHDLVALDELRGAAGENGKNGTDGKDGKDGINGTNGKDGADGKNGKDGINGKNIEVQRAETHIQWRYEGDEWQNLVAIADITGPAGQKGADGANGKTPEFRVNENTLQWRYVGDEVWLNLYDLSVLRGLDGKDGKDGADGEKGDKGDKGDPGQSGGSSGYFHAKASTGVATLQNHAARIEFTTKINRGGLISASGNEIRLKKGHIYNIVISGSLGVSSNASGNTGYYGIQMTDSSEDADFCRNITRIKRDGTKLPYSNDYHLFNFNRMYDASARDITLKFLFEQSEYNTLLEGFSGTITITALD